MSAFWADGSLGSPAAAMSSGVKTLAIRSLPPEIRSLAAYSSFDQLTGRPTSRKS